jgi:hypothetical protein
MSLNSSKKQPRQILGVILPEKAERLLWDLANLPGRGPLFEMDQASLATLVEKLEVIKRRYELFGSTQDYLLLCDVLRRAWDTRDERDREWLCFKFRQTSAELALFHDFKERMRKGDDLAAEDRKADLRDFAPPINPVEAAIFHFQHQAKRALHCPNPDCPAPYFFASRKGQKYCSEKCAEPAQRAAKRNWWQQNRGKAAKTKRRKTK